MRIAFMKELTELARADRRITVLTGDLGFSVFEPLIAELPGQFINAGIAEQSMTGIAAGLAMEGKIPVIYSIVPFVTMRNFEQIRNDICYQGLNVKIVGVGAGFSYGPYGHTHHGLEDMGILRTLAGMVVLAPGDPVEVKLATRAAFSHEGPVYIRLGKAGEPTIHTTEPAFAIGKGLELSRGSDVTVIACSTMLERASVVCTRLEASGISAGLISMPSVKPVDTELITGLTTRTRSIVTLEEHAVIGGLGSAVAEVLAETGSGIRFRRIAVPDRFTKTIGKQEHMRAANGLSVDEIIGTIGQLVA